MGQTRRIIVAGIKGWRVKMERCKTEEDSQKESSVKKMKDKLLGKSSWFRKPKGAKQDN